MHRIVRSVTLALAIFLLWLLPGSAGAQIPEAPPDGKINVKIGYTTAEATVKTPVIAGIVVLQDQLRGAGLNVGYPFVDGKPPAPPERGTYNPPIQTRTLFMWGQGLRSGEDEVHRINSLSPHITYRLLPMTPRDRERGWANAVKLDPDAEEQQARYSAFMLEAKLQPGITPGTKYIEFDGAAGAWPLIFGDQLAIMRFVREGDEAQYNPTDVFYSNDVGFVEMVYNVDIPFEEITIDLRRQRVDSTQNERLALLSATRLSDRPRPTFRTEAIQLADIEQPPPPPPAPSPNDKPPTIGGRPIVRMDVGHGEKLLAQLYDEREGLVLPRVVSAEVRRRPNPGQTWQQALERVAACYNETGVALTPEYAKQPATIVSRLILTELGERNIVLLKGHHAAAILFRDEFVAMAKTMLRDYTARLGFEHPNAAKIRAAIERAERNESVLYRLAMDEPLNRPLAAECNVEELLVLAGQEAPAVLARVLQRLVVQDLMVSPPRWRADRTPQGYVKGLQGMGAELRAVEELAAIDDAYKGMALAFAANAAGLLLNLGGAATAAGYVVLAGDAVDMAVFGTKAIAQYYQGEKNYDYALGATPVLGSDAFLAEAEAGRQNALMTAVGVIAPGVSGLQSFRHLRNVRSIENGRALLRNRSLDDLDDFSPRERADVAAYFVDLRLRAAGSKALDEADNRALTEFEDHLSKLGLSPRSRTAAVQTPPADPYDAEAWKKYYEQNPNAPRSVGAAAADDPAVFRPVDYASEDIPHSPRMPKDKQDPQYPPWAAQAANQARRELASGKDPKEVLKDIGYSYHGLLYKIGHAGTGEEYKPVHLRMDTKATANSRENMGHHWGGPGADPDYLKKVGLEDSLEFERIAKAELAKAGPLGSSGRQYQNTYITKDGKEIVSTTVDVDAGHVAYPDAKTSGEILDDIVRRTSDLLNHRRELTSEQLLTEFADIVHGFHHAVPFERGSDGVSQAFVRGLYSAIFDEKLPPLPTQIDIKAQLRPRESFEKWFIEQIRKNK